MEFDSRKKRMMAKKQGIIQSIQDKEVVLYRTQDDHYFFWQKIPFDNSALNNFLEIRCVNEFCSFLCQYFNLV